MSLTTTNNVNRDDDNDDFVLPTQMLAPTHLWASSSSSDDDDEGGDQERKGRETTKKKQKDKTTYLAPFVATPSSDSRVLVHALERNNLIRVPSTDESPCCSYTVCDVGCGDGSFLTSLCHDLAITNSLIVKAIGFDIDEEVIDQANKSKEKGKGSFLVADICKFKNAEELMCYLNGRSLSSVTRFNGIYIYLFPEAMKRIEAMISQLIDFHRRSEKEQKKHNYLDWIVTRRWKLYDDDDDDFKGKLTLVEIVKEQDDSVPFFVYKVL